MTEKSDEEFEFSGSQASMSRSPMTLALLFYIVTTGGIISACLRTLTGNESITNLVLVIALGGGAVGGFFLGAAVGLFYFRRIAAAIICSFTGSLIGLAAGSLALVPEEQFLSIAAISFGGCWVLVLFMLLAARFRAALAEPSRSSFPES